MEAAVKIYRPSSTSGALRQGEILSSLIQSRLKQDADLTAEPPTIEFVTHPWAIIVSQDCDLEQDYKARTGDGKVGPDKQIPSVLFCEMIELVTLRKGITDGKVRQRLTQNKEDRYHFLEKVPPELDGLAEGVPELGVDFKRYFAIPTPEAYCRLDREAKRRCVLNSPYLEHFCCRFYSYQSRIALPREHVSESAQQKVDTLIVTMPRSRVTPPVSGAVLLIVAFDL